MAAEHKNKVNKVEINGEPIIDLTGDTVDPSNLLEGYTAHDKRGELIVGKMIDNTYSFSIVDGNLVLTYNGEIAPDFKIDQSDGHLYWNKEVVRNG